MDFGSLSVYVVQPTLSAGTSFCMRL